MKLHKIVNVNGFSADRYRRIIGEIYLGGESINLEMIKAELAEAYREKPAKGFDPAPYLNDEKKAKTEKRGLWEQGEKYDI